MAVRAEGNLARVRVCRQYNPKPVEYLGYEILQSWPDSSLRDPLPRLSFVDAVVLEVVVLIYLDKEFLIDRVIYDLRVFNCRD